MGWVKRFVRRLRYEAHLRSDAWQELRQRALRRAGHRCEWVARTGRRCDADALLEVHHLHYRTFGRETLADVQVLCRRHHAIADRRRVRASQQKQTTKRRRL